MTDEPTDESSSEAETPEAAEPAPDAATPAVREGAEVEAAVATGPAVDPRAEARRTRVVLPLLIPIAAILTVAFVTFNVSRIFLAASQESTTPAVLIAAGITLSILIGASLIAAFPDIRTSSLVIGLCGVMVVVLLAGSLVLGESQPTSEAAAGYVEPAGPAVNTLEVDALPELRLGSGGKPTSTFNAPGGINLIKYLDKGGTHTLVFDKNAFPGFELAVPSGKAAAKVDLKPDTTYTIFCTIPGHRAAGMEAELVVGAAGTAVEPGTKTPTSTLAPAGTPSTSAPSPTTAPSASQSSTGGT